MVRESSAEQEGTTKQGLGDGPFAGPRSGSALPMDSSKTCELQYGKRGEEPIR